MAHHKRTGPKSTRAGCLLCKPQKRQGAPKNTRKKISTTYDMLTEAADNIIAERGASYTQQKTENSPYLPVGPVIIINRKEELKRLDHLQSRPVLLFNEGDYDSNFVGGNGKGFDEFLDHAQLLTCHGEALNGGNQFTIRQMLNFDAPTAEYSRTYSLQELLSEISEDTVQYFSRRRIDMDDVERRLKSGYYEDTLTTCCDVGCGSTHALIRHGKCDVLFEVSAASLVGVEFFAFEIVG